MSIQRTHKQSDLEKRLKLLNLQLYGKKEKLEVRGEKLDKEVRSEIKSHLPLQHLTSHISPPTSNQDVTYLRQDLTKIIFLAALAFAVELGLYFGKGVI